MKRIEFTVDADLRVRSCTEYWRDGKVRSSGDCLGRPYHEVLPRILDQERDAVGKAVAEGCTLHLPDHAYRCIYETVAAPVVIEPIRDEAGDVSGAEIALEFPVGCAFVNRLSSSQSLIDIGKCASMLAHGVRNPLNAIKGAVVYLRSRYRGDPTFIEFADIIEEEIGSLDKFITGFLSTSFDSFEPGEVDLNDLLRKVEAVVSLQTRSSPVRIDFDLKGNLPVCANPFQVEHALMNLLNNALQAMPEGGTIRVRSTLEEDARGRWAWVEIADNGPGFPDGFVKEVSTPFSEPDRKGRGFGLFIAREVFQSHGGSMEIRSEPGHGTRVVLRLPVVKSPPAPLS